MKDFRRTRSWVKSKSVQSIKMFSKGLVFSAAICSFSISSLEAAGKAPPNSGSPGSAPKISTPYPVRSVILQPMGTKAFQLPNGTNVNLSADLQSILNTAVASTSSFSPADPNPAEPCDSRIELRSAVTSFQMDVATAGVSFGYVPGGSLGPITNLKGKVTVQIGTISMDFSVWKCEGKKCSSVAASTATQATANVGLSMEIDFSMITTSPSFVFNTPLAGVLRQIMLDGMSKLSGSQRLSELAWQARVRSYVPSAGLMIFDAGVQSRIAPNQGFEIYAPVDSSSTGGCNVFRTVAYAHTTTVNTVSSQALVDQVLDSRGIQEGDIVMIRHMESQ